MNGNRTTRKDRYLILIKIFKHFRRPWIELLPFALDKLRSFLWRRQFGAVGRGFHVGGGSRIQGGRFITVGDGFVAGQMLWILSLIHI